MDMVELLQIALALRGEPAPFFGVSTIRYFVGDIHIPWALLPGYERAIDPDLLDVMREQLACDVLKPSVDFPSPIVPAEPVVNLDQGRLMIAGRQEPGGLIERWYGHSLPNF